jgi:hypothetical protein
MIECALCRAENEEDAVICVGCGRPLPARRDLPGVAQGPPSEPAAGAPAPAGPGLAFSLSHVPRRAAVGRPEQAAAGSSSPQAPPAPPPPPAPVPASPTPSSAGTDTPPRTAAKPEKVEPTAAGGGSTAAEDDGSLSKFLEELDRRHRTISVIGNSDVGKTFFINQAAEFATALKGLGHDKFELAPDTGSELAGEEDKPREQGPDIRVDVTRQIWIHELNHTETERSFRFIDIPGEWVNRVTNPERAAGEKDEQRFRKLYPALGGSDALILIIPCHYVFDSKQNYKARKAAELLNGVRRVSNVIANAERKHGDLRAAIEAILGWSEDELRTQLDKPAAGKSHKPIVALLSQADRCFGVGEARNPEGIGTRVSEADPMLAAARHLPTLVSQLDANFEDFRVDFLTAAEGQAENDKNLHDRTPSIGVWEPVSWLLDRMALQNMAPAPAGGLLSRLMPRGVARRRAAAERQDAKWAIELRKRGDRRFREALRGSPDAGDD